MFGEQYELEKDSQGTVGVKNLLGFFLVLCGVMIAFWVFWNVYELFTRPEELTRFQQLVSGCLETIVSFSEQEARLVIPPEFLAYVVPLILLIIAASVAGILITGGINLTNSSFQRFSRRIGKLEYKLKRRIDAVRNSLNKNR